MNKNKCPECGKDTNGSYSEGGIHFAVCEDCYNKIFRVKVKKGEKE